MQEGISMFEVDLNYCILKLMLLFMQAKKSSLALIFVFLQLQYAK